jgi:hypothetical protein
MARLPSRITSLLSGALPQIDAPADFMASDDPMAGMPDGDTMELAFERPQEPQFALDENGEVQEVLPDEDQIPASATPEHVRNLAEDMDEKDLARIAADLIDDVEQDIEDREPHMRRFKRGLEMLGLSPDTVDDGAFPGAASVSHNLISEAIVQFWARALPEMAPANGPAKALVLGKQTKAMEERARRQGDYLNFDMMTQDDGWYANMSRTIFAAPTHGNAFKKVYRDPVLGKNVSIYVNCEDFIVPWNATDLRTTPRYTHRIWRTPTEIKKAQAVGHYRKIELEAPDSEELTETTQLRVEVQDLSPTSLEEGARHELYEINVEIDLPGYEDEQGIPRPYVITVDKSSEKVLSIYRGWKEQDPSKRRRVHFVDYPYIPGLGFYSLGLFHLLGGIQDAATGSLRAILDGAATASLQGGFVSKDANLRAQRLEIEPGVWKAIDATSEDVQKAFFSPPFKEPSPALFNTLQFLTQRGEKFAATTELMTGETNAKAPVGSVVAVIEQASKVSSTIHRGLHMAMAQELRLRKELIEEHMPPEGYPYDVDGAHEGLLAEDFAPGVSIVPVSDPNIFSSAQRVAIAQVAYDLATQNPDIIKRPIAVRRMLEAARVPDVDELLVSSEPPPPMDPISQVQALLRGEPVQAYPDQMHQAHIDHLAAFMQNPGFGANPEVIKQIGPMVSALIGQHLGYLWATHARAQGVPAPLMPPPGSEDQAQQPMMPGVAGEAMQGQMIDQSGQQIAPPEVLASMAAQIAPVMAQVPGLPAPPNPDAGKAEAEDKKLQAEMAKHQSEMGLKERELSLKEQELQLKGAEAQEKAALANEERQRKAEEYAIKMQRDAEAYERQTLTEQQKSVAEAERIARDRADAEKKAMHDDIMRGKEMEERDAKTAAAMIEAERKAKEAMAQDNERTSADDKMAVMLSTIASLDKAIRAPKQVIRDPITNKAIGVVPVDVEQQQSPAPQQPKGKSPRKK